MGDVGVDLDSADASWCRSSPWGAAGWGRQLACCTCSER
jgi:hypothetical protein